MHDFSPSSGYFPCAWLACSVAGHTTTGRKEWSGVVKKEAAVFKTVGDLLMKRFAATVYGSALAMQRIFNTCRICAR